MPSLESREFWVVFDTGTRPEYYQDVHNLLALPKGAVMRYEYRKKYLSERALRWAIDEAAAPTRVVLIYGQKPGFTRGSDTAPAKPAAEELQWACTRFGTMRAIPSTDGDNFYFDFSVEGYPKIDEQALKKLLAPLIANAETPFHKWVAVSDDLSAYNDLNRGDEQANWETIVDRISGAGMQFRSDSFWRLRPANSVAEAKLVTDVEVVGNVQRVRQVSSRYELRSGDICNFEMTSRSPVGRSLPQPSRVLKINLDARRGLILDAPTTIDLRQYTGKFLKFRAGRSEEDDVTTQIVEFKTFSDQTAWPDGPNFPLSFQVSQRTTVTIPKEPEPANVAGQDATSKSGVEPPLKLPGAEAKVPPPDAKAGPQGSATTIGSTPEKLTPWSVLQAAIKAVPAVKYALGVAGLASAAAIAASFFQSPGSALIGTVVVFVLAVLLFLFSTVTRSVRGPLLWPGLFLMWSLTLIFIASLFLTFSTVFFAYPMSYAKLVHQFQPTKRATMRVNVVDQATGSPITGALIAIQNPDGAMKGFTGAEGVAVFGSVPVGEERLVATVSAAGYQDVSVDLDPSIPTKNNVVKLSRRPEAQLSVRPPIKKPQDTAAPPRISGAANMNGTWQVFVIGDINNARLRNGTFQFQSQSNGEILANANFVLDGARVTLSGTATAAGSQVFLKFDAKSDSGDSWPGRGSFGMETSTQMNGRIQPKSGDDVPLTLKKIPQ